MRKLPDCCIGCPAQLRHHCGLQEICARVKTHRARMAARMLREYDMAFRARYLRKKHERGYK